DGRLEPGDLLLRQPPPAEADVDRHVRPFQQALVGVAKLFLQVGDEIVEGAVIAHLEDEAVPDALDRDQSLASSCQSDYPRLSLHFFLAAGGKFLLTRVLRPVWPARPPISGRARTAGRRGTG